MRRGTASPPPLYDPTTEHDACGVGFVADAGGRSRDRVLPLALAGLASLGHRGAFAADGASSDGAGVALPLEAALVDRLTAGLPPDARAAAVGNRPGVLQLFLPRGRVRRERARAVVAAALDEVGLSAAAWRRVPTDPSALGPVAFASRPAFRQAFVARPIADGRPVSDVAFERRLLLARRRIASAAVEAALDDLAVASGSCRTIVYKGLVTGDRLARLYPDLVRPLPLAFATFHQRYATNTHPTWRLAQPFGHLAHNGEINTVRGNREELRGRRGDPDRGGLLAALGARGALLTAGGSDSASLDEAVELLVASGWSVAGALAALIPEAAALRADGAPGGIGLARRSAGFLAPWDGPAAIVFTDPDRRRAPRPERAAAAGLGDDAWRPRRGSLRSRSRAPRPCRDQDAVSARPRRDAPRRARPAADPGRRGRPAAALAAARRDARPPAGRLRRPAAGRCRRPPIPGPGARPAVPRRPRRGAPPPRSPDDDPRGP
jgi:glutamate synthase domain-containing protein 1